MATGREVFNDEKVLLVMVGLPARGKSFISHKVTNFLSWMGVKADIFNVGSLRRRLSTEKHSFDFFDANNAQAKQQREELAFQVLDAALDWLASGGEVAIFDATNTTRHRRLQVQEYCRGHAADVQIVFIESICDDRRVLETNFMEKVTNSPDYKDMPVDAALVDLKKRIQNYESVYETIDDDELSYIKLINMQSKVVCNRIYGNVAHLLTPFLMSIHIVDRPIYLCRPGHSEFIESLLSPSGERGSPRSRSPPSKLSTIGERFARHLRELFVQELAGSGEATKEGAHSLGGLRVYTCTNPRALQTIAHLGADYCPMSALNNVDTGAYAHMSLRDIRHEITEQLNECSLDPFTYRDHGGESVGDLVRRLSSFVVELERQRKPTLVVSHLLNLEVLYCYLLGRRLEDGAGEFPQHVVVKLTPTQYGWKEQRFDLSSECISCKESIDV